MNHYNYTNYYYTAITIIINSYAFKISSVKMYVDYLVRFIYYYILKLILQPYQSYLNYFTSKTYNLCIYKPSIIFLF